MRYFAIDPPIQLRAGFTGEGENQKPLYFDCAACDAKAPPIAGCLADAPAEGGPLSFDKIGVLTDPPRGPRHALFCKTCFDRILAEQQPTRLADRSDPLSTPAASAPGNPQPQQQQTTHTTNMTATIKNGHLLIDIELNEKPQPSATGKTLVVASTHGNTPTQAQVNGKPVIIGLNAYIKP